MLRVRDDDVLLIGRGFNPETAVQRFKEIHKLIVDGDAIHVAAVLCGTIYTFPGLAEFLREQYENGTLIPEIHGWEHVDYGPMSEAEIKENLAKCVDVIKSTTNYNPTKFYTPWGGNAPYIASAAQANGLEMVDTSNTLEKPRLFTGKLRENYSRAVLSGEAEFMIHWWADRWIENDTLANTLAAINSHGN